MVEEIDMNCKDEYGNTGLYYAVLNGNEFLVNLFLSKNANPDI